MKPGRREPNLFAQCVLPGCDTPVDEVGQACAGCRNAFGDMLRATGGPPMTEADIAERDSYVHRQYQLQALVAGRRG